MKALDRLRALSEGAGKFVGKHPYLLTILLCLLLILLYPETHAASLIPALSASHNWMLLLLPLLALAAFWFTYKGRLSDRKTGLLLCAMGFCMRLGYVLATPYYVRQHDVGRFDGDSGHAAYITYIYENLRLPDFDVREVWQFYHPPLHHSIAALWMRLLTGLGISFEQAGESVQFLTLAYSCVSLVIFWKILQHFHLRGIAQAVPLAIMAFHPTFLILAGSINNDMLSITFMLASVLLTLQWYRNPKPATILKLALTIGLGMMAKLSAWMVAPAAAAAFLAVLWRNRKRAGFILRQFAAFGCICVPLGLGWGIRNYVRWGVPPAYVPMLSDNSSQFVGNHPFWERLLDFSLEQFRYVYECFTMYGQSYDEYNPLVGLLKTAMFDELINPEKFPAIAGFGETLFFSQILLVLLSVAAPLAVWRQRQMYIDSMEKLQLTTTAAVTLVSYYGFCLSFAHVCTQNIRYATPLIVIGCLFIGLWLQQMKPKAFLRRVICAATLLFILASYAVYALVCA